MLSKVQHITGRKTGCNRSRPVFFGFSIFQQTLQLATEKIQNLCNRNRSFAVGFSPISVFFFQSSELDLRTLPVLHMGKLTRTLPLHKLILFCSSAMLTTTTTPLCLALHPMLCQCPPLVPQQPPRQPRLHPSVLKAHGTGTETRPAAGSCARSAVPPTQVAVSTQSLQWLQ